MQRANPDITPQPAPTFDFDLFGQPGDSIWRLRPKSDAGKAWVDTNINPDAQWFAGAVAIEHRYIDDILTGIDEAGLEIFIYPNG